ncbi:hypothetical protein F2Q68_00014073 [Brassica cretica]|uniref:Protein kinase domain-containing protein n=1 Tax=Brassica cretica TaxID=69181 RepID=A0A8S9H9C4_BRACR|nr:hypothetical protein F2Q68_00014073 [Brassica cretica]
MISFNISTSERIVYLLAIHEQKRFLQADNKERVFFPPSNFSWDQMLKVVTSQAFASAGRRSLACVADQRRRRSYPCLSTRGEARARAWQVATPPVAIGQGIYISVFGAREPETGRILAFKKARFDNFEADSVRSITRQIVILRRLNQVFLLNQKLMTKDLVKRTTTIGLMRSTDVLMTKFNRLKVTITITPQEGDKCCHVEWTTEAEELSDNRRDKTFIRRTVDLIHGIIRKKLRTDRLSPRSVVFSSSVDRRSPSYSRAEKVSTQTTKKGISKSKPSPRKAPPKHAATQVSDATQLEICLKVVTSQAFASAGRRRLACVADQRRRLSYPWRSTRKSMASGNSTSSSILRLILQIGQGMYISVFGAREPETGRILAFKKARGSKRLMQDVDACVRKLKVEALARARKEFVHISNGFVLCRKSNKVEKDHDKSYIWWLMVKRVL